MQIRPRVNLYIFAPHPEWKGVSGTVIVAARDFQRAEKIGLREAEGKKVPARSFSILLETPPDPSGSWVEIERYRNVEDDERLIHFDFNSREDSLHPS